MHFTWPSFDMYHVYLMQEAVKKISDGSTHVNSSSPNYGLIYFQFVPTLMTCPPPPRYAISAFSQRLSSWWHMHEIHSRNEQTRRHVNLMSCKKKIVSTFLIQKKKFHVLVCSCRIQFESLFNDPFAVKFIHTNTETCTLNTNWDSLVQSFEIQQWKGPFTILVPMFGGIWG